MSYQITPAIRRAAERLGVTVKASTVKGKKLDAFDKDGRKIRSFGAAGMADYHVWKRTHGLEHAERRRKAYWSRHAKDANVKYAPDGNLSAGYLAARILW